jgi:hypothetical protein
MDRLSSCYFCGTALDASLSEYPVVPRALQTADTSDRTVVLCPTCRRKLATIVESVVAAAGDADVEGSVAGDAATLPSAADDEDLSGMFDESGMDPQPDPTELSDANETADDEAPVEESGAEPGTSRSTPGTGRSQDEDSDWAGANGERAADGSTVESTAGDRSTDSEPETERNRSPDSEPTTARDTRAGVDETASADDGSSSETTGGSASGSGGDSSQSADDDGQSLTRLEYNKVMRLLQNRELPVDRADIRTVAVNAYEIEPTEFDTIVDAAIDRDLIAERDGQLVAPE